MKTGILEVSKRHGCLIGMALALAVSFSASASPESEARLSANQVINHPHSGWGFNFPAISGNREQIAVIDLAGSGGEEISLEVLRVSSRGLEAEMKFPLPQKQGGHLAECAQSEACVEEAISEPNGHLEANRFITMWPLYGAGVRELSLPREMISFYHYRILFDKDEKALTIVRAIGKGPDGALAEIEYQTGEIYLHERWPMKEGQRTGDNGKLCSGAPVPYAAWVNPDWGENGTRIILLRIGYVSPEDCELPDEWFVKVIE